MRTRIVTFFLVGAVTLPVLAGCAASYDERMAYLRKVANEGAETHQLLVSQEAPKIDTTRCSQAWAGLGNVDDFPTDVGGSNPSDTWKGQIEQFFVDSCVSGKPKEVPGAPPASSSAPSPSSSGAPVPSSPATAQH